MKIIVAGGTGLIGKRLVAGLISGGHQVLLLTRKNKLPSSFKGQVESQAWDGNFPGEWTKNVEGADAVINLCGEGIAEKKWTPQRKERLRASRLGPTRALVQAMSESAQKPKVFISVSAVGYYGFEVQDAEKDESAMRGNGFLAELCDEWENAAHQAEIHGIRVVIPRVGVVLEKGSGFLGKMVLPFEWLLGGPLGSGKQWLSWIHVQDLISLILFSLRHETVRGCVNACAPNPVPMEDFCVKLGKVMKRPSWVRVSEPLLRLVFGEMSEIISGGQKAFPRKITDAGFIFRYPALEAALISVLRG